MRVLGIDFGAKYIGLAVADTDIGIAIPRKDVPAKSALLEITDIIKSDNITKIVIGLPLSFKMEETSSSQEARKFGKKLAEKLEIPIEFENEILTTAAVERQMGRKKLHSSSAALILQSWLEKRGREEPMME